ncbi:MAG: hypothetical protein DDT32_02259 [Syntrophomonadaceae bacterium]|nr:hypothetical protein [Bacillota bacterium]
MPRSPLIGARVILGAGTGITVKVAVAGTMTPTVAVIAPVTAPGSMVTVVAGIAPAAVVMKVTGAMRPGGPDRTPGASAGNLTPVTVTTVPGTPLVGDNVIAAGSTVTVKVAVAEMPPTVAVKIAGPAGAPGSIVARTAISPPAPVMKCTGVMTPAGVAVRNPGALPGKPDPMTVIVVPGGPVTGVSVSGGGGATAAAGAAITAVRLATRARMVRTLSIRCFVFI